jgi:ankyrin repeat protein
LFRYSTENKTSMNLSKSLLYPSTVLLAALLVTSAGLVNCKGKGEGPDRTSEDAKISDQPEATADQQTPSTTPPEPGQNLAADQQALNEAALNGDLERVKLLLEQDGDPNGIDPEGRTALMFASFNGHTETVRMLLEAGAEVATRDAMGRTALLYACTGPFAETVKLLLDYQADPNIVDHDEHFSPLMHAAAEGQLEVVKLLLKSGADPMLKDIDGETAALFARNNGYTEVAGLIQSAIDSR